MQKLPFILFIASLFGNSAYADKVLVTIGQSGQVTERQLETAMQAAPFATQFPSMDEQDQAYLRGDILLRMAKAEALYQEALASGIQQETIFKQEISNFRTALLAQRYLTHLRQKILIPEAIKQQLSKQYQGNSDALTAARSAYIAQNFTELKNNAIQQLKKQAHIQTYFERLDKSPAADTLLAEGTGVQIKYSDLVPAISKTIIDKQRIIDKVNEWIELSLTAKVAAAEGENIDAQTQEYAHNLTIRLFIVEKENQWIPDDNALRDYFQKHPKIAYIPERRQIGQIVLSSRQEAEAIRQRIIKGESLFTLASQYSIDPYGRQRSGDMGWLPEGSASQKIEQALKNLKTDQVSPPVKTDKGWHLIMIVDRKPSQHKLYSEIKDRVRQKFLSEKMTAYLPTILAKHPLQWQIPEHSDTKIKVK